MRQTDKANALRSATVQLDRVLNIGIDPFLLGARYERPLISLEYGALTRNPAFDG
jgi:hypothetical protein